MVFLQFKSSTWPSLFSKQYLWVYLALCTHPTWSDRIFSPVQSHVLVNGNSMTPWKVSKSLSRLKSPCNDKNIKTKKVVTKGCSHWCYGIHRGWRNKPVSWRIKNQVTFSIPNTAFVWPIASVELSRGLWNTKFIGTGNWPRIKRSLLEDGFLRRWTWCFEESKQRT